MRSRRYKDMHSRDNFIRSYVTGSIVEILKPRAFLYLQLILSFVTKELYLFIYQLCISYVWSYSRPS